MSRIRTIKPEFWEDEIVGTLSRDTRLMMIACLNLADDEGILRWTAAYLKASVFMYDDDIATDAVESMMHELEGSGIVFAYSGGRAKQKLALIVNFKKHQKINRPSPSKHPLPSLQNAEVRLMYAKRDRWTCHICGHAIPKPEEFTEHQNDTLSLAIDHVKPIDDGGDDSPSNLAAAHSGCNKSKRNKKNGSMSRSVKAGLTSLGTINEDSVSDSVNDSVSHSLLEGKGREQGNGRGGERARERDEQEPKQPKQAIAEARQGVAVEEFRLALCRASGETIPLPNADTDYRLGLALSRAVGYSADDLACAVAWCAKNASAFKRENALSLQWLAGGKWGDGDGLGEILSAWIAAGKPRAEIHAERAPTRPEPVSAEARARLEARYTAMTKPRGEQSA